MAETLGIVLRILCEGLVLRRDRGDPRSSGTQFSGLATQLFGLARYLSRDGEVEVRFRASEVARQCDPEG